MHFVERCGGFSSFVVGNEIFECCKNAKQLSSIHFRVHEVVMSLKTAFGEIEQ